MKTKRFAKIFKEKASKKAKNSKFNSEIAEDALYMARGDFERVTNQNLKDVLERARFYYAFLRGGHPIL